MIKKRQLTIGTQIHDIFKRRWLTVLFIYEDGTVELSNEHSWIKMDKNDVIAMIKASPLNRGLEYDK